MACRLAVNIGESATAALSATEHSFPPFVGPAEPTAADAWNQPNSLGEQDGWKPKGRDVTANFDVTKRAQIPGEPQEIPPATPGNPSEPPQESPPGNPRPEVPPPMRDPVEPDSPRELPPDAPDERPVRDPKRPHTPPVDAPDSKTSSGATQLREHDVHDVSVQRRVNVVILTYIHSGRGDSPCRAK